jgi:hypothetical protein
MTTSFSVTLRRKFYCRREGLKFEEAERPSSKLHPKTKKVNKKALREEGLNKLSIKFYEEMGAAGGVVVSTRSVVLSVL